ncbi:MAG: YidC/Oxa1 family membrane protein insertase [Patescibacteria group bacterium]
MISEIYHIVFYQPLHNGLVFLTNILPFNDLGLAIIILTLFVRFVLFPLSHKSIITQRKIKNIEPEITKIKEKHKKNKEEIARKTMALYKEHGISPFSGFLMIFIQLPVFIALFILLKNGANLDDPNVLYSFIKVPENINTLFLGLVDLSKSSLVVSVLAGLSQFLQIKLSMPKIEKQKPGKSFKDDLQRSMGIQMKYVMPIFIVFIAQRLSSGIALYWTVSNVFAILHEIAVSKKSDGLVKKIDDGGENSNN